MSNNNDIYCLRGQVTSKTKMIELLAEKLKTTEERLEEINKIIQQDNIEHSKCLELLNEYNAKVYKKEVIENDLKSLGVSLVKARAYNHRASVLKLTPELIKEKILKLIELHKEYPAKRIYVISKYVSLQYVRVNVLTEFLENEITEESINELVDTCIAAKRRFNNRLRESR